MTRISSRWTLGNKWGPSILFAGLAVGAALFASEPADRILALVGVAACVFFSVGFWTHFDQAMDEVYDCDDSLLLRRKGIEERIKLTGIRSIEIVYGSPPRIILHLQKAGSFGAQPWFFPPNEPYPAHRFAERNNDVYDDLLERVNRTR